LVSIFLDGIAFSGFSVHFLASMQGSQQLAGRTAPATAPAMQDKRADYFACGTLVLWDVDLLSEDVVKSYKASNPDTR
jgi:hypothetical protein